MSENTHYNAAYEYKIGTPNKDGVQIVYRNVSDEMKNHPKYKLAEKLCKEKYVKNAS